MRYVRPLILNSIMDWIMTKTVENDNNGIRWNFTTVLEDIDFADDLALLSSKKTHIQKKEYRLSKHSKVSNRNENQHQEDETHEIQRQRPNSHIN